MNEAAFRAGVDVLYAMEPRDAIQAARSFYSGHWDSINAQRMLMWTMIRAAGRDGAIDAYQRLQVIAPESAVGALLTAQVAHPDKAAALLEPAVKLYSKEFFLRLNYARTLYLLGRYQDAVEQYKTLVAQHERAPRSCYEPYALALVGVGRNAEAVKLVAQVGDLDGFPVDFRFAVFYGRLAGKVAAALRPHPADTYLERTRFFAERPDFARALFQAVVTGEVPDEALLARVADEEAAKLVRLIGSLDKDLTSSLVAAPALETETLRRMDNVRLILLAGELVRRGAKEDAGTLMQALHVWSPWKEPVQAAVLDGTWSADVADMDLELQAALKLVQARRLGKADKAYEKRVAEAGALDILRDVVAGAARWPLGTVPGGGGVEAP